MYRLGLDFGSTLTKMVMLKPEAADFSQPQAIFQYHTSANPVEFYQALGEFLKEENISLNSIDGIYATGTHVNLVNGEILGIPTKVVSEIDSIGRGALALAELSEALVVNMGTGTTFVYADANGCHHIAGSGVGGGTLSGLGSHVLNGRSVKEITQLAKEGSLDRVDLLMKDVTDQIYPNLPQDLTASNFGKLAHPLYKTQTPSEADVALGLINLVLQVIGSMAVMACKTIPTKNVVFVGTLTRTPQIREIYDTFSKVYGLQFIVPPFAMFATALGAGLTGPVA